MATADKYLPLKAGAPAPEAGPIPVEQFDAVQFIQSRMGEAQYFRYEFERNWYRNALFYIGQQWITYSRAQRRWIRADVPEWFPTPVTNKFAAHCDGMMGVFEQSNPKAIYGPATDSDSDMASAEIANDISDVIREEAGYEQIRQEAQKWLTITGNAFLVNWYDTSPEHGTVQIGVLQCVGQSTGPDGMPTPCGFMGLPHEVANGCPQCGGKDTFQDAINPLTGQPITKEFPRGKMMTEVAAPFEIYSDLQVRNLDKAPWIVRARTYPLEYIKMRWGEKAKDIKPEGHADKLGQFYLAALSYITNSGYGDYGLYGSAYKSGGTSTAPRATVYFLYLRPDTRFPNGVYAVVSGGMELEKQELPNHDSNGKAFVPVIHFRFKKVVGRLFGKTPADDLVFKQVQRNKLESLLQLGITRMANPVWLLPDGCGIENVTGEPGEKIRYNPAVALGHKPERVAGSEMPGSVFRWMQIVDTDFEELSAMYDVMKGSAPKNVPTMGGLDLLRERGLARFADAISDWEAGWLQWNYQMLWIFKEWAVDTRLKTIQRDNGEWMVKQFTNADLTGNVSIRAEPGSASPRSEAYQRFVINQMLEAGLIDVQDPSVRLKIFQIFHIKELMEHLDGDMKDAIIERDEFLKGGQTRFRMNIDNHPVHASMHRKWAKTEEFRKLPPDVQAVWERHIEEHDFADMQLQLRQGQVQQAALAISTAANGRKSPQPGPQPGQQAG